MSAPPIRVLVVDDSLTVRRHLVELLSAAPDIEVVGEAADGRAAIDLCGALRPDVMTLDMRLPELDGLGVTEHVMAYFPTPILIVSASTNRGELLTTYDALAAGALEVLDKSHAADPAWDAALVDTVRLISRVRVITHPRGRLSAAQRAPTRREPPIHPPPPPIGPIGGPIGARLAPRVVVIGVSTGGPAALVQLLGGLAPTFPLPILLVIHIADAFGAALAEWLGRYTPLPLAYAREGEPLGAAGGRVLMAPPGRHLVVRAGRVALDDGPARHSCRPSVDVLFESVAADLGPAVIGCLLTGMGRDGAEGLLAIRRAGGLTLAQDEATSAIFGMPRAAIALGAADHVLPLERVAPALTLWAHAAGALR